MRLNSRVGSLKQNDQVDVTLMKEDCGMTPSHYLVIVSAALGALGTATLFKGTWASEPFEGGGFNSNMLQNHNREVRGRNRRRTWYQRGGLAFLMLSFILQGIAAMVP